MNEDYMFEDEVDEPKKTYYNQGEEPNQTEYRPQKRNDGIGLAIVSFVLGLVALILFLTFINFFIAIAAITLGIIYLVTIKDKRGKPFAITGIVTGILSIILLFGSLTLILVNIDSMVPLYYDIINSYELDESDGYGYEDFYDFDEFDVDDTL